MAKKSMFDSSANDIIDMFVAIDVERLLKDHPTGTYSNPTFIDHTSYSYMIVANQYLADPSSQATGDLKINAKVNDMIRWRSVTLSGNAGYAAILYNITKLGGTTILDLPAQPHSTRPYKPDPILPQTAPPTFNVVKDTDYYLQATVEDSGTENYNVFFYVTQNNDKGQPDPSKTVYYAWDPTVVVQ